MDDNLPYMIMSYTNGPGYDTRDPAGADGCRKRKDYTNIDTSKWCFCVPKRISRNFRSIPDQNVTLEVSANVIHF